MIKPCPFCGWKNIDLSYSRSFNDEEEKRPTIAAGCWKCDYVGPSVEFESSTGYEESAKAWNECLEPMTIKRGE